MRVKNADKALAESLPKLTREHEHDKVVFRRAFTLSGEAMVEVIRRSGVDGIAVSKKIHNLRLLFFSMCIKG